MMVWVFIVNLLIGGAGGGVGFDVGPFATQAQCNAAQQAFTIYNVRTYNGGTAQAFGWNKTICISRP